MRWRKLPRAQREDAVGSKGIGWNGGCETGAPFEIVTMINRVGIVYLGGASPSTCTRPKLYFSRMRIRENGGYVWEVEREGPGRWQGGMGHGYEP